MRIVLTSTLALLSLCFAACSNQQQASTPTTTINAYFEAVRKKDVAAMKQYLSQGTLKLAEEDARTQNITIDQALIQDIEQTVSGKITAPETRNEQITGDEARLEVNNPAGGWDIIYFTKENGQWKIALDKMAEEVLKDMEDMMPEANNANSSANQMPEKPATPASNVKSNNQSNK